MELELSEDQEFFRETTRKFLESNCPLSKVRELEANADGFERDYWIQAAELGWTSMFVPEEHGGGSLAGEPLLDLVIVAEEMGRLVSPGPLLPVNVVAAAVAEFGSEAQQSELLPGLLSGHSIATWALAEPNGRWDPAGIATTAESQGAGITLNGTKSFVEAALQSDQFLVTARTGEGLSQVLVPAGTKGVTATPMESLDLVRRIGEVRFDNAELPAAAVVGELGGAADAVERQLQIALALQCAETAGATERVFEFTLEWAFDRHSFGRPLASYQALKHRFADMKTWLEASQGTAAAAARAVQTEADNANELVSVAKSYIGEHCTDIIQDCVQMHGGIGVTWEHDIHLYLRRATLNRGMYGTPNQHRERICTLLGF